MQPHVAQRAVAQRVAVLRVRRIIVPLTAPIVHSPHVIVFRAACGRPRIRRVPIAPVAPRVRRRGRKEGAAALARRGGRVIKLHAGPQTVLITPLALAAAVGAIEPDVGPNEAIFHQRLQPRLHRRREDAGNGERRAHAASRWGRREGGAAVDGGLLPHAVAPSVDDGELISHVRNCGLTRVGSGLLEEKGERNCGGRSC